MFLGEKVGIEYLYSQTGQVWQSPLQQEEPQDEENLEDKDGEGFYVSSSLYVNLIYLFRYSSTFSISISF